METLTYTQESESVLIEHFQSSHKLMVVTVGASGSGKTSFAEMLRSFVNLNRDDIRFGMFTDGVRDWTKYKFNKTNENAVTEQQIANFQRAVESEQNIIVSDTNLNYTVRQGWIERANQAGYNVLLLLFPCDWATLVKRNAQRIGGINEALLFSMYKRYMQEFGFYGEHPVVMYKEDRTLDHTIIVDLDGTIADMKGVRRPFQWDLVDQDKPRYQILDMLYSVSARIGHITFMSGRDGCSREKTIEWLERYVIADLHKEVKWDLVMREAGDSRKDDVVKYELFNKHVRGKFNVDCVFDDRYSVIRMWSVIGLPNIIQVGEYGNEF